MGIINDIKRNETAIALQSKYTEALNYINALTKIKADVTAQLNNMKLNTTDFTKEDCDEVQAVIDDVTTQIHSI